jgi:hypothetical protein
MPLVPDFHNPNIRALLDASHPGALYVVSLYVGYTTANCEEASDQKHLKDVALPALMYPIHGSLSETDLAQPGCAPFANDDQQAQADFDLAVSNFVGLHSDALLYLGPRKSFLVSPNMTDGYFDQDYRAEMSRRMLLRTGQGLSPPDPAKYNPATSVPYWKWR